MDEFGSPIAGGIRAVRRSVSSSVFRPVQRQEPVQAQPDSITTNLLSQNSLTLTSISSQLQNVSAQVASLNISLRLKFLFFPLLINGLRTEISS